MAVVLKEDGWESLSDVLRAEPCLVGAPTLFELRRVLAVRKFASARAIVDEFLAGDLTVRPFGEADYRLAEEAFERFGQGEGGGKEASVLNIFDCMTYATARAAARPLLFKGDDFGATDLTLHSASQDSDGVPIGE